MIVSAILSRSLRNALVLALAFVPAASSWAADSNSLEFPIKAAFLVKFGEFIDWPEGTADGDYTICVLGADAMGAALDQAARDQSVRGRPVTARTLKNVSDAAGCKVVFLGDAKIAGGALAQLRGKPILTVTDERNGATNGQGIVHFTIRDNRVRFLIDDEAAAVNKLEISSKLLSLAVSVSRRRESAP